MSTVTHPFVNPKADGADATVVRPSNWNASHTITAIGARAYHNALQALVTATFTALALNSERWDTDTIHDLAVNNSRLTCKTAGKYVICGNVEYAVSAAGTTRLACIKLNGITFIAIQQQPPVAGGVLTTAVSVTTTYDLAVNDYIELVGYQDSGGNLNVNATGNYSPEFSMVRTGS